MQNYNHTAETFTIFYNALVVSVSFILTIQPFMVNIIWFKIQKLEGIF